MDKLAAKREELNKVEIKIKALNQRKVKLQNEINMLELQAKSDQYEALEVYLQEKGMNLSELLKTLN